MSVRTEGCYSLRSGHSSILPALNFHPASCYSLRSGHSSILPALNFHPAATREPDGLCGNQRYRRELLMMGIMVPETCWAKHKDNKVISGILLDFILQLSRWYTVQYTSDTHQTDSSVKCNFTEHSVNINALSSLPHTFLTGLTKHLEERIYFHAWRYKMLPVRNGAVPFTWRLYRICLQQAVLQLCKHLVCYSQYRNFT